MAEKIKKIEKIKKTKKIEWETFWKRYASTYPIARTFQTAFTKNLEQAWQNISTHIGEVENSGLSVDEKGKIRATMLKWLELGILCDFMLKVTESKTKDTIKSLNDEVVKLKEETRELIEMKERLKEMMEYLEEERRYRAAMK